ncbi:hypothetical protein ACLB2K_020298 [Fragaria x ananassa]
MEKSKSFPEYTSSYSGEFGFRERSNSYNFNGPNQKGNGFATAGDPELQRKKRVASYNVFTMEGLRERRGTREIGELRKQMLLVDQEAKGAP